MPKKILIFLSLIIIFFGLFFATKSIFADDSTVCINECAQGYTPQCCYCYKTQTSSGMPIGCYLSKFTAILINYVLGFLFALMFVFFVYGLLGYIRSGGDEQKRKKGIQYIMWGIIGLFVAFSVWGLVNLLRSTFSLKESQPPIPEIKINY